MLFFIPIQTNKAGETRKNVKNIFNKFNLFYFFLNFIGNRKRDADVFPFLISLPKRFIQRESFCLHFAGEEMLFP